VLAIKGVICCRDAVGLGIRMVICNDVDGRTSRCPQTATARRGASASEGEVEQPLKRRTKLFRCGFGYHRSQARRAG